MQTTDKYTIKELTVEGLQLDPDLFEFIIKAAKTISEIYDHKFNWGAFRLIKYINSHRITVCYRGKRPVGVMCARLYDSIFDGGVKILFQDLLYAEPGTRAAKVLLDDFIDFGKLNANHVITCIGTNTNIKEASLERLGFKKLETLYRMEIR